MSTAFVQGFDTSARSLGLFKEEQQDKRTFSSCPWLGFRWKVKQLCELSPKDHRIFSNTLLDEKKGEDCSIRYVTSAQLTRNEVLEVCRQQKIIFPHIFLVSVPEWKWGDGALSLAVRSSAVWYFAQWLSSAKMHEQILHLGPETRRSLKPEALPLAGPQSQTLLSWVCLSRLARKSEVSQEMEAVWWQQLSLGCLWGYGTITRSPLRLGGASKCFPTPCVLKRLFHKGWE